MPAMVDYMEMDVDMGASTVGTMVAEGREKGAG